MMFARFAGALSAVCILSAVPLLTFAAGAAGNVDDARLASDKSGDNWLVKGGSFAQAEFSPLTDINDKNVMRLGFAWSTDIDDPMGLTAEPLVVDGVVYLSAPRSIVYAIDATSGKVIWRFDPKVRMDFGIENSGNARVNRGVAVWAGKVYVGTGDGRLIAIDASTGAQRWEAQVTNPVQSGITGAPRVGGGKVFMGYSGSDSHVRGSIAAFDADSGKEVWRFWTVPGDPAKGFETKTVAMAAKTWSGPEWWKQAGGAVWDTITYDGSTGLLLFGTSKAFLADTDAGQTVLPGAKLFSGSIVAVRADTGEYVWHYQTSTPLRQTENFHIVLADLKLRGRVRHVAMSAGRNGTFYVLEAKSGELISATPLVAQGFPKVLAGWGKNQMDYPGVVINGTEDCKEGCFGVRNWWPMSYNSATQLVYVPVTDLRRDSATPAGELPMVGRLMAWDPKSNRVRWSVEDPIMVNGGAMSTAGNLVFQGQGNGEFAAYAADSGRKLWSQQTGSAVNGSPVTYRLNGEQYVIVPVGWGGMFRLFATANMTATAQSKYGPTRLLAFKVGSSLPFPSTPVTVPAVPRPPAQSANAATLQHGESLANDHCFGCHSPRFDGSGRWILNGGVPDLRYMPADAHRDFYAIVLGGSHRMQGMLSFAAAPGTPGLSKADADDIHAYIIDRAWAAYDEQRAHAGT